MSASSGQPAATAGTTAPAARSKRVHDPVAHRRAVLEAARRLFSAHGYDGTSIRAVAAEAGVTAPLVLSYFGSKDGLFKAVVAGAGTGVAADVVTAAAEGPDQAARALAHGYLERWDRLPADDPWPALIRSAATHPPAAGMLRELLDEHVAAPLAELLDGTPGAEVTTALVRSVLFGVINERYLFAHEPARSVPTADLEPALAQVLAAALAHSLEAYSPPQNDAVERIMGEWHAERPGTDVSAMSVFGRLHRCYARYQSAISRVVERHGINLAAFDVLTALRRAGAPYRRTLGDLAATALISTGGTSMRADRLERAGLVVREREEEGDRRVVYLRLTPAGLALVDETADDHFAGELRMLAGLSAGERRRLTALLGTLEHSLDEAGGQA